MCYHGGLCSSTGCRLLPDSYWSPSSLSLLQRTTANPPLAEEELPCILQERPRRAARSPGPPTPGMLWSASPLQRSPAPAGFLQGGLYLRFLHLLSPSQPHQPSAPGAQPAPCKSPQRSQSLGSPSQAGWKIPVPQHAELRLTPIAPHNTSASAKIPIATSGCREGLRALLCSYSR